MGRTVPEALYCDIELPYLFDQRSYQWPVFEAWDQGIRRFLLVWHRRCGKDKTLLNFMIMRMLERKANYIHLFPLKVQARRAIWQGIDREGKSFLAHFPPELLYGKPNDQEMRVTLIDPANPTHAGSTYNLLGADKDTNVVVGSNPVGAIISEYSTMNPLAVERLRPILNENKGWLAFDYTPRGKNHGFYLYERVKEDQQWFVSFQTVDMTRRDAPGEDGSPVITAEDIAQDQAEGMSEADILQEYYCSFETPMPGAVYGQELRLAYEESRVGHVPILAGYEVRTCWDLGYNDTTAIWFFQVVPGVDGLPWYHFVDYAEDSLQALVKWVKYVREQPYRYLDFDAHEWHYAPHDAGVHEYGYGKTRESIALEAVTLDDGRMVEGLRLTNVGRGSLQDGLETTRKLFKRFRFDNTRCTKGLGAIASYRYAWDENNKVWTKDPVHDWASHAADALRTGAVGLATPAQRARIVAPPASFEWHRRQAKRGVAQTYKIGG